MAGENREIIDATQDAVLNVADSVVSAIETTAQELGGHAEPFYQSAEFWVAVSFVLAVVALARPVGKAIRHMLRKRARLIGKRIEDASNLKEEAQKLLAEYERKYRRAKQEAAEILSRSEREINLLRKDQMAKLERDMASREREAKARIKSAQEAASKEIAVQTAEKTISVVKAVLAQKLDGRAQDRLIEDSIRRLEAEEL